MKRFTVISMLLLAVVPLVACSRIQEEAVDYTAKGVVMKGFLAYDKGIKEDRPGVLVVHEWWGHNEYARERARKLAKLGYTALAVDMYGEGKQAAHPEDAGKFSTAVMKNMPVAKARFMAALDLLKKHETVDPDRIAAIGYCFGGGVVLQMAREGVDLDGVVSFHGSLTAARPAKPGAIKARILACHGASDAFIPEKQVKAFKQEMQQAGADLTFISYPGAMHSFTNPASDAYAKKFSIPLGYSAQADKESWEDMKEFLEEIFADQDDEDEKKEEEEESEK